MRRSPELRPRIWDGMVVLAVVALAVLCAWRVWGQGDTGGLAVMVSVDGVERERIPLEDRTWTVTAEGYTLEIDMTETEVWVAASDCPTQDCVHTGHISRSGQSIICLPARVSIQLVGGQRDGGVDAVIG